MGTSGGKGDGRDSNRDRDPRDEDDDKVIRLPRDWLGPREELVPFGPSAEPGSPAPGASEHPVDEPNAQDEDASARAPLEEVSSPAGPVSPDDFWGERSAALQGPLEEADRDEARDGDSSSARRRVRVGALAAGAVAVVALVIVSLSLLGQSSRPGKARVNAGVDSGGGRGILWPLPASTPPGGHQVGRSRHARSKRNRPSHAQTGASVAVNYVRQPSSSQTTAGGGGSSGGTGTSPAAPSGAGRNPTPGAPAPSSGAGSTTPTGESSSSRHQSNPPPFGADGALGPGHSGTG